MEDPLISVITMPTLDVSELNVVVAVLGKWGGRRAKDNDESLLTICQGTFVVVYGLLAVKIKSIWYLGEACKLFSFLYAL